MARSAASGAAPLVSIRAVSLPCRFTGCSTRRSRRRRSSQRPWATASRAAGRSGEIMMYGDFIGRAGDEIFNQLAKWQAMSAGLLRMPVVLRCSIGSKYGAQHSQDWSGLIAHIPGLKLVYPATPYDAKGLLLMPLCGGPIRSFSSKASGSTTRRNCSIREESPKGFMKSPSVCPMLREPERTSRC